MVRRKFMWKFGVIFSILLLNVFTKSLPIDKSVSSLPVIISDTTFANLVIPDNVEESLNISKEEIENVTSKQETRTSEENLKTVNEVTNSTDVVRNTTRHLLRQQLRPGQDVRNYNVEITIDGGMFRGRAMIDLRVDADTREDALIFYAQEMTINSVLLGVLTDANALAVDFDYDEDDGILEVHPDRTGQTYVVIVEYTGMIRNDGTGIFRGDFNGQQYLGMNLYPLHARKVFPCVDELTEVVPVLFNFINVGFPMMVANSVLEDNSQTQFRTLATPLHLWGMVAHNFQTVMIPVNDVLLRGRTGLNQDSQATTAIQYFFNTLNEWTSKNYFEIIVDQNGQMNIFALPDTSVDWSSLSTVCLWEPYVYMEQIHSVAQKKTALVKIADQMARQWFGFVIYPENWRHEWAITGLRLHAVYDIVKEFQHDPNGVDTSLLDMHTLFTTDIIQESLLRDGYANAEPLLPPDDILDDFRAREYINGLIKYKAPAVLRMLRLILGNENNDYIKMASQSLLNRWSLEPITSLDVITSIENEWWSVEPNKLIDDELEDFLDPWINSRGYPLLHVGLRQGGVLVTQEQFGFTAASTQTYTLPITYTTSLDMIFDNIYPIRMMDNTITLAMVLDEEERDFVLFNIQGQGYYRVAYDDELWERIIECLEEPDCRNQIHPLNRATLVDDALNLARAGKLDYEFAFRVVLTMEHETEYAPWKAFIRNMEFLKKRLLAYVFDDEDLDPDIYLRMVRRTIGTLERELTFYPDPLIVEPAMTSLTRGMVMNHACRVGYIPCIAAAIDWFYDPNSADVQVNPDIPKDLRPAVYCAMVREGDAAAINALYERLEVEPSHWERVVILEALACSQDESFINMLLLETIASNSPYGVEERFRIFAAVAESSYQNAIIAINFARMRTIEMRSMYGGDQKLEELIYILGDNAADDGLTFDLSVWIDSINSNLFESVDMAERIRDMANENVVWDNTHLLYVYEWIDENDAPKMILSGMLLCMAVIFNFINH